MQILVQQIRLDWFTSYHCNGFMSKKRENILKSTQNFWILLHMRCALPLKYFFFHGKITMYVPRKNSKISWQGVDIKCGKRSQNRHLIFDVFLENFEKYFFFAKQSPPTPPNKIQVQGFTALGQVSFPNWLDLNFVGGCGGRFLNFQKF